MNVQAFVFDAYGTLFDTHSVLPAIEAQLPARAELVAQLWRLKQLEYSWLRTVMGRHADFGTVTREALRFALDAFAPGSDEGVASSLCGAFDRLRLYPDAEAALAGLGAYRLGILSNGSPTMLEALLEHAGCRGRFEVVVSTEAARVFKPHPDAYRLIVEAIGLPAHEIALVSSNGFDLTGAKASGLRTVRIERTTPAGLREELGDAEAISPHVLYAAMRSMADAFLGEADLTLPSLASLASRAPAIAGPSASA